MAKAAKQLTQARNRIEGARARTDTRAWVVARRERTRHLIELGGLVQKAGLVELADDDRAMLYGAFLEVALQMRGENATQVKLLFRRRGVHAFATEAEKTSTARAKGSSSTPRDEKGEIGGNG